MQSILGKRSSSSSFSCESSVGSCAGLNPEDSIASDTPLCFDKDSNVFLKRRSRSTPKSFAACFRCSRCRQTYLTTVCENPWYANVREKCPHCQQDQMPTLDINLPINARELDPNIEDFYSVVKDEEFLDLGAVESCEDFSLELTEPVLRLLFADHFRDEMRLPTQREDQTLSDVVNLRLLSLVMHAIRCTRTYHANIKQTTLCRNTKVLLLHLMRCRRLENCQFPHCFSCRSVVSYLSAFPVEAVFPTSTTNTTVPIPTTNPNPSKS